MRKIAALYVFALRISVVCLAVWLFVNPSAAQAPTNRQFVPGELLVGFKSASEKDKAVEELSKAGREGGITTRSGGLSETVEVEPLGERAIKLKLDFLTKARSEPTQEEELNLLLEKAQELKKSNERIQYAHPNWIQAVGPPRQMVPIDPDAMLVKKQSAPRRETTDPNDPAYQLGLHWHYDAPPRGMNAIGAWQHTHGSRDIVVAIIDSGILFDNPDVKGSNNVLKGYDFITVPETARDGDGRDPDATDAGTWCPDTPETAKNEASPNSWHGTHVAGTIGAATDNKKSVAGVNWQVSILPVRALGKCGGGNVGDIADAIKWAAGLPVPGIPPNPTPAHIINTSLGGSRPCTWEENGYQREAILLAQDQGAVIVAAAGNENMDLENVSPASCPGVISVTASDPGGSITTYSNFGAATIMAPGGQYCEMDPATLSCKMDENTGRPIVRDVDEDKRPDSIWSLWKITTEPTEQDPIKNSRGAFISEGTSMAAPHVSAAIALAMSTNQYLRDNPDLIERALKETAAKLKPGQCPDAKPCGAGQLDALKLLQYKPSD